MSWQPWIDNLLARPPIDVAAIYGLDGSVWAKSASNTATDAEAQALVAGLKLDSAGKFSSFSYQDHRFMTLRLDGGDLMAKSKDNCMCAIRSSQCVVVGCYLGLAGGGKPGGAEEKVRVGVAAIKDALANIGY